MAMSRVVVTAGLLLSGLSVGPTLAAEDETRGVGVYPGDPREDFAPVPVPDGATYRNLALRRPAYHSSSYDYNLTAQLVTDGIKETTLPRWLATTTSENGVAPKSERELLVDHASTTGVDFAGPQGWVQFELAGGDAPFRIDRIELEARPRRPPPWRGPQAKPPLAEGQSAGDAEWTWIVSGSDD